jgi:hypothetical protein
MQDKLIVEFEVVQIEGEGIYLHQAIQGTDRSLKIGPSSNYLEAKLFA